MKTLIEKAGYKVEYNGSKSWFVCDETGDCLFSTNSERKAINRFNKILNDAGVQ